MQAQLPKDPDEITLKELVGKLKRLIDYLTKSWLIIALVTIAGIIAGVTYSSLKKTVYTAECTFVVEDGEKAGGASAYSGVASLMGLDIGGSSGLFQGENLIDLYKSRLMIEKTLLSKAQIDGKQQLLIDRYIEINKLRDAWSKTNPKIKNINFSIDKEKFTLSHDSVITQIVNSISNSYLTVEQPSQKNFISVTVKSEDQYFAKEFTDKIVDNVNAFYVQTKTKRSLENINILVKQVDSLRYMLNSSMRGVASAGDANPNANPALQSLHLSSQRRQVDVQSSQALYMEEMKNLELAKIALRKERPIIQVIDGPVYPLSSTRLGKVKGAVVGGMLAFFIITVILIVRKSFSALLT